MPEFHDILFYLVFLGQILLLSLYFPQKVRKRIQFLFETYPPENYPRLYPRSIDYYKKGLQLHNRINTGALIFGFLLLAMVMADRTNDDWAGVVAFYFFVQMVPLILMEISSFSHFRQMREADTRTKRTALLQPRRFFDFVQPKLLGAAVLVYLAFVAIVAFVDQFDFPWFGGYWNVAGITLANLLFAAIALWNIYGKRQDPYQAFDDRLTQVRLIIRQLLYVSIIATVFVSIMFSVRAFELGFLTQTVMSAYFQLIAVFSFQSVLSENANFDVYKAEPATASS